MPEEMNSKKITNIKDEVLEVIWEQTEEGSALRKDLISSTHVTITDKLLDEMIAEEYLLEKNGEIDFTTSGKAQATHIIRAHRLAERLFTDVLEISDDQLESNACNFEHVLSPEVSTAICCLLGHPTECPHGKPIPPGPCCKKDVRKVEKIVHPLTELKAGDMGKILYISIKHHARLDQLIVMGIAPGAVVKVHQTFPTYILQVGETSIAMDNDICGDIYVRKLAG